MLENHLKFLNVSFPRENLILLMKISTTVPLNCVKTIALAQIWLPTSNVEAVLQASLERIVPRVSGEMFRR